MSENLEIIEINTFQELAKIKDAFEKTNKLGIDIRKLTDKNERRRVRILLLVLLLVVT